MSDETVVPESDSGFTICDVNTALQIACDTRDQYKRDAYEANRQLGYAQSTVDGFHQAAACFADMLESVSDWYTDSIRLDKDALLALAELLGVTPTKQFTTTVTFEVEVTINAPVDYDEDDLCNELSIDDISSSNHSLDIESWDAV